MLCVLKKENSFSGMSISTRVFCALFFSRFLSVTCVLGELEQVGLFVCQKLSLLQINTFSVFCHTTTERGGKSQSPIHI